MSITVSWDNDQKTALYMRTEGAWTWAEFHQGLDEGNALISSVNHRVDIISHLVDQAAQKLPPGAFEQWRRAMKGYPGNAGIIILVPGNVMVHVFTSAFLKAFGSRYPLKFATAQTLEGARALTVRLRDQKTKT